MKKILFSLVAVASICALGSCQKSEIATPAENNTITAVAPVAKTTLGENGVDVLWTAGNKISVVLNDGLNADPSKTLYTLVSGAGSKAAKFSGSFTADQIKAKGAFALYPGDAVQACHIQQSYKNYGSAYVCFGSKENQYTSKSVKLDRQKYSETVPVADNTLPMYAEIPAGTDGHGLHFKHLCGIIKFVFTSKSQKAIGTVTLKDNSTDINPLTGEVNNNPLPVAFRVSNTTGDAEYIYANTIGASASDFFSYNNGTINVTGCGDTSYAKGYVKTVYMIVPPLDGYYDLGYNGNVQFKNKYLKVEAGRIRTINVEMK